MAGKVSAPRCFGHVMHGVMRMQVGLVELRRLGYVGFTSFGDLREGGLSDVPNAPGTYAVCREDANEPKFLPESCGGYFKGKDPRVRIETLTQKWVSAATVLYIGKAGRLRRRLREFARFGDGKPFGHWGGRYLWQIEGCQELLVAWRPVPDGSSAREEERIFLSQFVEAYGALPFGNLTN